MKGYKATDKDMKCLGYQFTLGEWHELPANVPLVWCKSGFHFCDQPSGPWNYYNTVDTRIFEVEAECVEDPSPEPGTEHKLVCRRIRFVREITPGGNRNTGDRNTGDRNTGDRNTGDRNTGNSNTGDSNAGYSNTGYRNTGYRNTGNRNTGYRNTGNSNTGKRNTGDRNTGDRNTGDRNTGDRNTGDSNAGDRNTGDGNAGYSNTGYRNTGNRNTGYSNATNYSSGYFCVEEQPVIIFDGPTTLSRDELSRRDDVYSLMRALLDDSPIPFEPFAAIPNITPEKLQALHAKHIAGRAIINKGV